jgi:hypothetical protein
MLWPKEHGAYAQLAFPLASGLAMGGAAVPSLALAAAAIALFLAAEPLEVLVGARGARAHDALSGAARRQLAALGAIGAAGGIAAIVSAPQATRMWIVVPGLLGVLLGALVLARRVKTLGGEIAAVAAFASLHLPLAAWGGASGAALRGPVLVWAGVFASATFAVHALKARHKGRSPVLVGAATALAALVLVWAVAVALGGGDARRFGWAAIAPAAAALYVAAGRVHPRHLKRVGWTLVLADLLALGIMLAG